MKDQTTQTQPMRHQRRDSSSHNKGPVDCDNWHQRRARSLTRRSDRLIHSKIRCRSSGRGINQFRHASHSENWHFRNDRGQSSGKHNEHSSEYENWCRTRANNSSYESDPLVRFSNRPQGDGYRVNPIKHAPECDNCRCRNGPSQDGVKQTKQSDAEDWHKRTARSSSPQSNRPVHNKSRCHSVGHGAHRVRHGSEWKDCDARNDGSQDGVKHSQHSSDIGKWRKRTTHESPFQNVSCANRPHSDGRGFNPFKQPSHCENCHSRNDCSQDSVKPSDCENWHNRRAYNSYRPGVHFVVNRNRCHTNRYRIKPLKRATHARNWHSRNDGYKDGIKDPDHSYCKNLHPSNPHGTSCYAIWAIFNRKLSHKTHGNKAFAQLKYDCENWRSWHDHHRDHADQRRRSPEDKNWCSMGDCARDEVERCDQSPNRDVTDQGERDVQRVADRNKDQNETEVQNMHGSDTGRTVMLKAPLASNYTNGKEVQLS